MNRQIRNSRANQRLQDSTPRLLHEQVRIVAPIEIVVLLRPNNADIRDGAAIDEVLLMGLVPAVKWFGSMKHAPVFRVSSDVMPPGLDAASKTLEHPEAGLGFRFAGQPESRFTGLIQSG